LCTPSAETGEQIKIFKSVFAPPSRSEEVQTVIIEAMSDKINPRADDVSQLPDEL